MLAQCSDICPQLVAQFGEGVETFDMGDIVEGGESLVGQLFENPEPQAEFSATQTPSPELPDQVHAAPTPSPRDGLHLNFPP